MPYRNGVKVDKHDSATNPPKIRKSLKVKKSLPNVPVKKGGD